MTDGTRPPLQITAADDRFHPRTDDPYWNESSWFSFCVPERRIGGMIYTWFRPNMGYACGGPMVWDPSGDLPWDCLWYDYNWLQPIGDNEAALDCRLPNGTTVEVIDPLRRYRLHYLADGCEIDLLWTASGEPRPMALADRLDVAGTGHFDQPGRAVGRLRLGDHELSVDCASMRDRSWGPRRWTTLPRSDYVYGLVDGDDWFLVATVEDGDDDKIVSGHYVADGTYARIEGGRRRTLERRGTRPLAVAIEATDELGRRLETTGVAESWFACQAYPEIFYWQTLMRWDLAGSAAVGELAETLPLARLRAAVRAEPGALGTLAATYADAR